MVVSELKENLLDIEFSDFRHIYKDSLVINQCDILRSIALVADSLARIIVNT
jgi:hypothetical protein